MFNLKTNQSSVTSKDTQKCKFCQENIDKKATRCPKCQSDLRSWFNKHPVLTVLLLIIFLPTVIGLIGNTGNNVSNNTDTTTTLVDTRTPQERKQGKEALARMKKTYDDIGKVTDYTDPSSPKTVATNNIRLYIRKFDNGYTVLRFVVSYAADDWLFVQKYIFSADGKSYEITPQEVNRDNRVTIWEWSDEQITSDELEVVTAIINSQKAKMRYEGRQYYKDRVITVSEKTALKNVLMANTALIMSKSK